MGADLISYQIVLPAKGTKAIVAKEVKRLSAAFKKLDKDKLLDDPNAWDIIIKALGIREWDYENDIGEQDAERLYDMVETDLENVAGFDEGFGARDIGGGEVTIGGKKVVIMYAGEMSWGETPEGLGYQTIGALWRLGIGDKIQDKVR
jgi:hypothetical protein